MVMIGNKSWFSVRNIIDAVSKLPNCRGCFDCRRANIRLFVHWVYLSISRKSLIISNRKSTFSVAANTVDDILAFLPHTYRQQLEQAQKVFAFKEDPPKLNSGVDGTSLAIRVYSGYQKLPKFGSASFLNQIVSLSSSTTRKSKSYWYSGCRDWYHGN